MSERNQSKASESSNKIPLHKVLEEELDYLDLFSKKRPQKNDDNKAEKKQVSKQGSEQKGKQPENTSQEENELSNIYKRIHIQASNRSALCLSGGGIRSATFSLGVIQGLAHRGLLDKFDYLSTVSGGGYIGSWLTAWAHRHPEGLGGVAKDLTNTKKSNLDPKPDPVNNLRSYSNYLTPKLGIMSADIWTLIAIYLRNLFLNWLAFIPLLLAALIIPRFCVAVILSQPPKWIINSFLIVGAIAVVITIYYIGINCPSNNEGNKGQPHFMRWCLLPLTLSAISFTIFWAWYPKENNLSILYFIGFGALLHFIGWLAYSIILLCSKKETVPFFISKRLRAVVEFITVLATGAAGGLFAWLMATYLFPDIKLFAGHYVCFAAPSFLGLFLIAGVLLVAFMGYHFEDRDLEWLARSGAWVLIAITIWSAGSSLVIFGPVGLSKLWEEAPTLIASVGGISGIITLFFSFSSKTSFGKKEKENNGLISLLMNNALIISASIFIIFLIAALSLGTDPIVRLVNNKLLTKISQTKTIDQSDFWAGEFKSEATIEKLCNTINDDFKDSFTPISSSDTTESINGLKDLLEHSDFYNIVQEKKPDKSFSKEITELVYKT
ncbi:MAG TPA: patatin-like phospholipase family protein, partial [Candidatus Wunengus sp. YC64]|uniref:patatin-like phospholipase family protein n=1 Tax=Candidatus Wunengus sp. YC64 TaxID=3367700 RepID=UPI004027BEDB